MPKAHGEGNPKVSKLLKDIPDNIKDLTAEHLSILFYIAALYSLEYKSFSKYDAISCCRIAIALNNNNIDAKVLLAADIYMVYRHCYSLRKQINMNTNTSRDSYKLRFGCVNCIKISLKILIDIESTSFFSRFCPMLGPMMCEPLGFV